MIIIGGGFSAFVAKTICEKNTWIITPQHKNFFNHTSFKRRSSLELNKLVAKKSKSYGTLQFKKDSHLRLHDRATLGGNSNVWGGLINIKKIPQWFIKKMFAQRILVGGLTFSETGSIANNSHIKQLITTKKSIVDVQAILKPDEEGYLEDFFIKGKKIGLRILYRNRKGLFNKKIIYTNRLLLCTGVVQTIDLLYRSNLIKNGDIISLSEFSHQIKYRITLNPYQFETNERSSIIRYDLLGAASHFLGLQKRLYLSHLFRWMPLYVDQYFMRKKNIIHLKIENGYLKKKIGSNIEHTVFGESIHYCNMRINGKKIDNFLKEVSPLISGLGMAFLDQPHPGPISSDIIIDSIEKLKRA